MRKLSGAFLFFIAFFIIAPSASFGADTIVVSITLNHRSKGDFFVKSRQGDFLIKETDLKAIGFTNPKGETFEIKGERYISLKSIRSVLFSFNEGALLLEIEADPALLPKMTVDYAPQRAANVYYTGGDNSAFLNYRFDYIAGNSFKLENFNVANEVGVRTHDILFLTDTSYTKTPDSSKFVRLTSELVYDSRSSLQRAIAGDFFASSNDLGSSLNMGGLSFQKVYRIDPYFIKQPLFNTTGLVSAPSEADVYINGMLIRREKLSPGEFELKNLSSYSGAGNVQVVIRDPFGREERLSYPFYFTDIVLKQGLHEYSYNIGFLRNNFGTESLSYGKPVFSLFHRYGLTDDVSVGVTAEGAGRLINLGPQASLSSNKFGLLSVSMAGSYDRVRGGGVAASISHIYQGPRFGAMLLLKGYSRGYATIDNTISGPLIKYEAGAGISYGSRGFGSASLDYTKTENYNAPDRTVISATYSVGIFRDSSVYLSLSHIRDNGVTDNQVFGGLTYYPWKDASASASFVKSRGSDTETVQLQENPPFREGLGYRATVSRASGQPETAYTIDPYLQYNSPYGIFTGEYTSRLGKSGNNSTYELTAAGGLVYVGGTAGISQPVADSFGVIKVGDLKGVKVYNNNQEIGETDSSGKVIVTNLNSYYDNQISVGNQRIPINYSLPEMGKTVSPALRSGSVIEFKASRIQGVTGFLKIRSKGDLKAVEFYEVRMMAEGREITFPTGRNGEFYLENIKPGRYQASTVYMGKTYSFDIMIPYMADMIINLGEIVCEDTV
jgi:outer membrane usher protein